MCTHSSADGLPTCAVKIAEMKARLPERITRAEAGEEIVIHCENRPVARPVPLAQTAARRSAFDDMIAAPDEQSFRAGSNACRSTN
jgi:antitoxin (DNA-binding transcriptional repressor) of toxin-antitoxin stability system